MERQGLPPPGSGTRACLHRCTPGRRGGGLSGQARSPGPGHVQAAQSSPAPLEHRLPHLSPAAQLWAWRDTSPSFSETQASVPRTPFPSEGPQPPRDPLKSPAGGCSPSPPRAQATPDDTRLTRPPQVPSPLHAPGTPARKPGEASRPSRPARICLFQKVCKREESQPRWEKWPSGKEPRPPRHKPSCHRARGPTGASGPQPGPSHWPACHKGLLLRHPLVLGIKTKISKITVW